MNIFVKCWRGAASLWQVFWLVGFLIPIEISVIAGWIGEFIIKYYVTNRDINTHDGHNIPIIT